MISSGAATLSLESTSRSIRSIDAGFVSKLRKGCSYSLFERTALDSHADASCVGSNATAIDLTGEKVNVYPFSDGLPSLKGVPIAIVLTIWESPLTGEVWGIVLHESLYFGDRLQGSLLCPNQLRAAGHNVQDVPVQFDATSRHFISVTGRIEFSMELHGVISFLSTRKPTNVEIKRSHDGTLQSVELTENIPLEPYSTRFADSEKAARAAPSVSVVCVTIPQPKVSNMKSEEEEERAYHRFQRPLILEERELAVNSRLDVSNCPIELADKDILAARIVAAVNVGPDCEMDSGGSSPPCDECAE